MHIMIRRISSRYYLDGRAGADCALADYQEQMQPLLACRPNLLRDGKFLFCHTLRIMRSTFRCSLGLSYEYKILAQPPRSSTAKALLSVS